MLDWDYEKNIATDPNKVSRWSKEKIWWKCHICRYEWKSGIGSRYSGIGCPKCSGKVLVPGENDFATRYPEIACEWDFEQNGSLMPNDFFPNSNKKVWWKCKQGHTWETGINNRTREGKGTGCPICAGKKVLKGYNDLESQYPQLMLEWDYSKNIIRPDTVTCHSGKKIWWTCAICKYEWEAAVGNRTKGHGCPKCSGRVKETPAEFKRYFDSNYPWLELLSDYQGAHENISIRCRTCGMVWNRKSAKLKEGYTNCPNCK